MKIQSDCLPTTNFSAFSGGEYTLANGLTITGARFRFMILINQACKL
eukprot:UN15911